MNDKKEFLIPEKSILKSLKETSNICQPDDKYSTPATYNWIKGLAMICDASEDFTHENLTKLYSGKPRLKSDEDSLLLALTYDNIMMSLNHYSSLKAMLKVENHSDVIISSVISWYYAIYNAAKAMLTANRNELQDPNHSTVAKRWKCYFVDANQILSPFNLSVSNVSEEAIKSLGYQEKAKELRYNLFKNPSNTQEAEIGVKMYLKGLIQFEQEKIKTELKGKNNIESFRPKENQELRDNIFSKSKHLGFLNMAFRFRGKANYRDSLFLTYNIDGLPRQREFILNMIKVSESFLKMTSYYLYYKLPKGYWHILLEDLKQNSTLSENGDFLFFEQK